VGKTGEQQLKEMQLGSNQPAAAEADAIREEQLKRMQSASSS